MGVQTGRILEGPRSLRDGAWRLVADMDSETCSWTLLPAESSGPPAGVTTKLSPANRPDLLLIVGDGKAICLGALEKADEDGTWKYCPDGRIESLAYPGKYLSAISSTGCGLHLWEK